MAEKDKKDVLAGEIMQDSQSDEREAWCSPEFASGCILSDDQSEKQDEQ